MSSASSQSMPLGAALVSGARAVEGWREEAANAQVVQRLPHAIAHVSRPARRRPQARLEFS